MNMKNTKRKVLIIPGGVKKDFINDMEADFK